MNMGRATANPESGFTLLEILLVVVILAVTSMMIAPSYFSASSVSIDDEGKRMVQVLRLGQEEAALSGRMFRVLLRRHSYTFQQAGAEGEWQTVQQQPYRPHQLSEGIQIAEVRPQLPLQEKTDEKGEEAVIARLLLPAEGIRQIVDIVLAEEAGDGRRLEIQLRPGPGGIRTGTTAE